MKKLFVIALLLINTIHSMQLIKAVRDWSDERNAHCFIQNFGSESFEQEREKFINLSRNALEKVFQKSEERDKELKHQLFSGAIILAALPPDLQKTIFGKIDEAFDEQTIKLFMKDQSLKEALGWHACVNKKMGNNPSVVFEERDLFGPNFPSTRILTKQQLLCLSFEKVILLAGKLGKASYGTTLWLFWYKNKINRERAHVWTFDKKQLTALNQLIQQGYIQIKDDVEIGIRYEYSHLFKIGTNIILPFIIHYYLRSLFTNHFIEPEINNDIRAANNALERFEKISGEGPFLRHELHKEELTRDNTIFFHCVPTIINLIYSISSFDMMPGFMISFLFNLMLTYGSLLFPFIVDNHVMPFDIFDFMRWGITYVCSAYLAQKKISVKEIPSYLNNSWISIK